jgi:hypothetical protein
VDFMCLLRYNLSLGPRSGHRFGRTFYDAQPVLISSYDAVEEFPTRVSNFLARSTLLGSGSGPPRKYNGRRRFERTLTPTTETVRGVERSERRRSDESIGPVVEFLLVHADRSRLLDDG